jgi:hypothetical protein
MYLITFALIAAYQLSLSSGIMRLVDCSSLITSLLALAYRELISCLNSKCASSLL